MQRAFGVMMGRRPEDLAGAVVAHGGGRHRGARLGGASELDRDELTESGGRLEASVGEELGQSHLPDRVLVDGRFVPDLNRPAEAVVGGDARIVEIQAASILAKTARDRWMIAYAERVPGYGFERHKGYPTAAHRNALSELGPSPIHRLSFRMAPSASS